MMLGLTDLRCLDAVCLTDSHLDFQYEIAAMLTLVDICVKVTSVRACYIVEYCHVPESSQVIMVRKLISMFDLPPFGNNCCHSLQARNQDPWLLYGSVKSPNWSR